MEEISSTQQESPTNKRSQLCNKKCSKPKRMHQNEVFESKGRGGGGGAVMLEGYIEVCGEGSRDGGDEAAVVGRTKSLTDEDLEDLKGCLDLGFGFNYEEIPELCNTLPALELCYSMSRKFGDEREGDSGPIANWRISSPGDSPDEVKARLKYWAQAVACTVRLCN